MKKHYTICEGCLNFDGCRLQDKGERTICGERNIRDRLRSGEMIKGQRVNESQRHIDAFEIYFKSKQEGNTTQNSVRLIMVELRVSENAVYTWKKEFDWDGREAIRSREINKQIEQQTDSSIVTNKIKNLAVTHKPILENISTKNKITIFDEYASVPRTRKMVTKLLEQDWFDWKNTNQINDMMGEPFNPVVLNELVNAGFLNRRVHKEGKCKYQYRIDAHNRFNREHLQPIIEKTLVKANPMKYVTKTGQTEDSRKAVPGLLANPQFKKWCKMTRVCELCDNINFSYSVMKELVSEGEVEQKKNGVWMFRKAQDKPDFKPDFVDRLIGDKMENGDSSKKLVGLPEKLVEKRAMEILESKVKNQIGRYNDQIEELYGKIRVLEELEKTI